MRSLLRTLGLVIFITAIGAEWVSPKYSRTERAALNWQVCGLLLTLIAVTW